MAQPISKLLRKEIPWEWGPAQDEAFALLKDSLCTPGLVLRPVDPSKELHIHTDFSGQGLGALLTQPYPDGTEHVCAAISRSLNRHEAAYSSFHGEMLACVWAVRMFHYHLHGRPFKVITDHQPLAYLLTQKELTGKPARWALMLAESDITIVHCPGVTHQDADALSRLIAPDLGAQDYTGARLDGSPSGADEDPAVDPLVANVLAGWDPVAPSTSSTRVAWERFLGTCVQEGESQPQLPPPHPTHPGRFEGEADPFGVQPTLGLCTGTLHPTSFPPAADLRAFWGHLLWP